MWAWSSARSRARMSGPARHAGFDALYTTGRRYPLDEACSRVVASPDLFALI
jgi:hypothetical protein